LDVGRGDECYAIPSGSEIMVKPGDMYTADSEGVLSAIITGPAARARIGSETRAALFVCYGPPGVTREAMEHHLETITANVRRISPAVVVIAREIVVGSD
jgi:DNA/RNA-binding domain of Phe-tRNA-synthetase-like protein